MFDAKSTIKKAKGIESCVVKKTIEFEDDEVFERGYKSVQGAVKHHIQETSALYRKVQEDLSARDDKKFLL